MKLWVGSIMVSLGIELTTELKMIKDMADLGYKINLEQLDQQQKLLATEELKRTLLFILVMPVNVLESFNRATLYHSNRDFMVSQLKAMDALEEMSEKEIKRYETKPVEFMLEYLCATKEPNNLELTQENTTYINEIDDIKKAGKSVSQYTIFDQKHDLEEYRARLVEEQEKNRVYDGPKLQKMRK